MIKNISLRTNVETTENLKLGLGRLALLSGKCFSSFFDQFTHLHINTVKYSVLPLTDILPSIGQVYRDIVNQMILLTRLFPENFPQSIWLDKIFIRNLMHERQCMSGPLFVSFRTCSL